MKKIMKIFNLNTERKKIVIVFLLAFILHEVCNLFVPMIRFNPDELGAISAAAKLAGYNWDAIWETANAYYGVIFGLIYTPLFIIVKNPFVLYQLMILINAVICGIIAVLAYKILCMKSNIGSTAIVCGAVACSFFTTWRSNNVMNETGLVLCVWICFYILIRLQICKTKRTRILLTICLNLCLGMALLSHSRSIIIVIAVLITLGFYRIVSKKNMVHTLSFIFSFVFMVIAFLLLQDIIQANVFSVTDSLETSNTWGNIANTLKINDSEVGRLSMKGITGFLDMLFGNMYSLFIVTGGLLFLALFLFLYEFCVFGIRYVRTLVKKIDYVETIEPLFWGNLFCVLGLGGSLIGYAILNWGYALAAKQVDLVISYYLYPRYFGIFIGPLLIIVIVNLRKFEKKQVISIVLSIVSFVIIAGYDFASFIYQFSKQGGDVFDSWRVTAPFTFALNWRGDRFFYHYVIAAAVAVCVLLIIWLIVKKSKMLIGVLFIMGILLYQYAFNSLVYDKGLATYTISLIDKTYELITDNEENDLVQLDAIYIDSEANKRVPYIMQFVLPNIEVTLQTPDKYKKNVVIFSSMDKSEKYSEYHEIILDEDEYLYIEDDEMFSQLDKRKESKDGNN